MDAQPMCNAHYARSCSLMLRGNGDRGLKLASPQQKPHEQIVSLFGKTASYRQRKCCGEHARVLAVGCHSQYRADRIPTARRRHLTYRQASIDLATLYPSFANCAKNGTVCSWGFPEKLAGFSPLVFLFRATSKSASEGNGRCTLGLPPFAYSYYCRSFCPSSRRRMTLAAPTMPPWDSASAL